MSSARHYSPFYRDFRAIDPADKQRVIREYEEKEREIGLLDPLENFELTVQYVDALFDTGAYRKHLLMVDLVIVTSIEQNIQYLDGEDVYERMLFRKAAASFRTLDYENTAHIARELIKIYPENPIYIRLLRTAYFKQEKRVVQFGRAAAIVAILATALIIVVDLLVVKTFYPAEHPTIIGFRNTVFLSGLLALASSYGVALFRARRKAAAFARSLEQ